MCRGPFQAQPFWDSVKSRHSMSPALHFWSSSVVHSSQTQAVCKAWLSDSLGNIVHFHRDVYYIPLKIIMERISRAEEAAQHFQELLQYEGMQSACFFPYPHCSDPENSLPQEFQPAWTGELLTNKRRMFLPRMCMKIHPFLLILFTMASHSFQSTMGAWLDLTGHQDLLSLPDSLYALWGALLSQASGKVGTQRLENNQPQNSTQYLGMSQEDAAEQHIYHLPTWEKAKPFSSPRRAEPRAPDSCWANK